MQPRNTVKTKKDYKVGTQGRARKQMSSTWACVEGLDHLSITDSPITTTFRRRQTRKRENISSYDMGETQEQREGQGCKSKLPSVPWTSMKMKTRNVKSLKVTIAE